MLRKNKFKLTFVIILTLYLMGYVVARSTIFHMVEAYEGEETLGAEAKGNPRQNYIAKRDHPKGEGWEYQLFMPIIKVEEGITNFLYAQRK